MSDQVYTSPFQGYDPGVSGLAQLGRNAIERVRQLERERDELRAGLERLAQLYEDEHDLCDRPMWLRELIARPAREAERAERERQEPVAWQWGDFSTVVTHREYIQYGGAEASPLYAAPPVPRVDPEWLAGVIRAVDGNHTLGAGALAEKIADAINGRGNDR